MKRNFKKEGRGMMDKHLPVSVWPEWKIVEKIGEGSFGKVYKACRTEQGTTFYSAIKVITIPSNQGELSSVRSESPNEQSVKEYFQGLVDECIQEVSTCLLYTSQVLQKIHLPTIRKVFLNYIRRSVRASRLQ